MCIEVVPHQWAHLVEEQLVDSLQVDVGQFVGLKLLKFNYPPTASGMPIDKHLFFI